MLRVKHVEVIWKGADRLPSKCSDNAKWRVGEEGLCASVDFEVDVGMHISFVF